VVEVWPVPAMLYGNLGVERVGKSSDVTAGLAFPRCTQGLEGQAANARCRKELEQESG
jgi:hypothetical protein